MTINYKGKLGTYSYKDFGIQGTNWSNAAGNYIFAKIENGYWKALYVGQTNDFAARFANHEKLNAAIKLGATHILAHVNSSESARKTEEADLIQCYQPPLNEKLK